MISGDIDVTVNTRRINGPTPLTKEVTLGGLAIDITNLVAEVRIKALAAITVELLLR